MSKKKNTRPPMAPSCNVTTASAAACDVAPIKPTRLDEDHFNDMVKAVVNISHAFGQIDDMVRKTFTDI